MLAYVDKIIFATCSVTERTFLKVFLFIFVIFFCIVGLSGGHSVLTTPTRVSAMNIVGDLLRKVGVSSESLFHICAGFFNRLF